MFWFYLAGWISGVVGATLFAEWFCKHHPELHEKSEEMEKYLNEKRHHSD